MAKVKISREEIEKMLKDQLRIKEVNWDKKGNAEVEIELQQMTEKKEETKFYPIYIRPYYPVWTPVWTGVGTATTSTAQNIKLCYSSNNSVSGMTTTSGG